MSGYSNCPYKVNLEFGHLYIPTQLQISSDVGEAHYCSPCRFVQVSQPDYCPQIFTEATMAIYKSASIVGLK